MLELYDYLMFAAEFLGLVFAFGLMSLLTVLLYVGIAALIKFCVRKSKKGSD